MGIQRRSLGQQEFNRVLMRSCPQKLRLVRASSYNCIGGTCFSNGRESISALCPVCFGTGYLPGTPGMTTYFIYGDLQIGHGLYGSGGDYLKLIADLGRQDVGDATLFTKFLDYDHRTGKEIHPMIDAGFPQPDQVISTSGVSYNIVRQLVVSIGSEDIARVFACEQGAFSPTAASQSR